MSRPPKPTAVLELTGAYKKNPQRRRLSEPEVDGPLGDPPPHFSGDLKATWLEISSQVPAGVATSADRIAFERMCRLAWKDRNNMASAAEGSQLDNLLGRFGMTPSDRAKLSVPKKEKTKNPFAEIASESSREAKPN